MKKEWWVVIALVIVVIVLGILLYNGSMENKSLNSEIEKVVADSEQLLKEKNDLLLENKAVKDELDLIQKDVAKIYKTCMNENACKGRYPGISWYCNNVGDPAEISMASHLCQCTTDCQLNATQINTI